MDYLMILLLLAYFPLPWIWVAHEQPFKGALDVDWIDGICTGFGIAFGILYLCSLRSLSSFHWVWLMSLVSAVAILIMSVRRRALRNVSWGSEARILVMLMAVYITIRSVPLTVAEYPVGWDPYFHLVLADKILRVGGFITDWRPFENIELNYPIGSHLLLALIAEIGKVPVHRVFTVATIVFTALTGAQVYALVTRAAKNPEIGLYASLSYLFLAVYGSLGYSLWGGLPNLIGMYLVLGLLSILHREDLPDHKIAVLVAVLFVAACVVHHHVMLTGGWILLWQLFYFRWIRPDRTQARRLTLGLALSAVIGFPYFLHYLLKVPNFKETGIVGYIEELLTPAAIMNEFGPVFFFSMLFGVLIFSSRKNISVLSQSMLQAILSLLVIYVLVQYVFPVFSLALLGKIVAPFTPSRFLTDCVVLLVIFSALFFFQLKIWTELRKNWIISLILAGFIFNWPMYRATFYREISEANMEAYEWIRNNTSADTIIIDPAGHAIHASYLTQRISSSLPIPTSEFHRKATNKKMMYEIIQGRIPPEAQHRRILFITDGLRSSFAESRVVWSHPSGLNLIEAQTNDGLQVD